MNDRSKAGAISAFTVIVALAIFFIRTPSTFTNPQFWGEDAYFFYLVREQGWHSLTQSLAGYYVTAQFLVANLASYFDPVWAPTIYNYAAVVMTLMVVWLVTLPRVTLPYKPLLAIAIVVVPMGFEELGTITNIQWILPIGVLVLLFMRPSASITALVAEATLVAVTAVTGPFSIFLTPLFLWRAIATSGAERRRLWIFAVTLIVGALIQIAVISHDPGTTNAAAPEPYSWMLWINLPMRKMATIFPATQGLFYGPLGVILGALVMSITALLALLSPCRWEKLAMLFFGWSIMFAGMFKFRAALESQSGSTRYFYIASVLSLWFICCLCREGWKKYALPLVVIAELTAIPEVARTPRIAQDLEWKAWAKYIPSGLPLIIPTSPAPAFFVETYPDPAGPLFHFNAWIGRNLSEVTAISPTPCPSTIGPRLHVDASLTMSARYARDLWNVSGEEETVTRTSTLYALTDQAGTVLGFGLPGFAGHRWRAVFRSAGAPALKVYGVGKTACLVSSSS